MSGAAELLDLAKWVEEAEADSPELYEDAFRTAFPQPSRVLRGPGAQEYLEWLERLQRLCDFVEVKAFLDAAMALVPEGWRFEVTTTGFKPGASIVTDRGTFINGGGAYAATPALALCAAALRARAAIAAMQPREEQKVEREVGDG